MNNKIKKSILLGIAGSLVMNLVIEALTILTYISPALDLPKFNPANAISDIMGFSIAIGYGIHVLIGILFAIIYIYFLKPKLIGLNSIFLQSLIFGIIVYVFTQGLLLLINYFVKPVHYPEGSMVLIIIAGLIASFSYAITVVRFSRD